MIVSEKQGQFAYFDAQLGSPRWRGRRVLDFGGNCGNFLAGAQDDIRAEDYWCLDVAREALAEGARRFPNAQWIHYDRRHFRYNPLGAPRLPIPDLGTRFDFILAYSVFTLLGEDELRELVPALRRMLAPGGVLAFSFIDPDYRAWRKGRVMSNVEWRVDVEGHGPSPGAARHPLPASGARADSPSPRTRGEGARRADEGPPSSLAMLGMTFLPAARVRELFPDCEIVAPTPEVRHHCCVLHASTSVLAKATTVIREPFPHVVIENALDDYRELADAFPSGEILRKGRTLASNEYQHTHANEILADARIAPVWRRFVAQHTSRTFYAEVAALFGLDQEVETSVRFAEEPRDVMMECQFAWCEPTTSVSSSAPRHTDRPVSIFAGLLYFRLDDDDSAGGDLELYRGEERVKTIPYRANTAVFFLNSATAFHAVSPRSITRWPRLHVNFVGERPAR